jgi:SAM-dependent methyltransferase
MGEPAAWLAANLDLLRPGGTVLDVACGSGRNASYLADLGYRVHAVDREPNAIASLPPGVTGEQLDLETENVSLESNRYDAVIVFNYLHRPLVPVLVAALAPGGVLLYETFTAAQALRGRPRNPDFLLQPGELRTLVAPLRVIREREGEFDGKCIASVAAIR